MERSIRKLVSGAVVVLVAIVAFSYASPAQAQSRHGHQRRNGGHYGEHQGHGGYQRSHGGGHYGGHQYGSYQQGGYHGQHGHGYRPAPQHHYAPSFGGHYHGRIIDLHFGF